MIRILILLIALISFSFGRYNETFSDFTGTVFDSTKAKWVFGSKYAGNATDIKNDQSGNGNDLTAGVSFDYTNQLTGTSPIYEGDNALEFDGLNDYWYIPAAQAGDFAISVSESATLEMYIKFDNSTDDRVFSTMVDSRTDGFEVFTAADGRITVYMEGTNNNALGAVVLDIGSVNDDNWHHIVIVINHGGNILGYLDSELDNTIDMSSITGNMPGNGILIGEGFNFSLPFNGEMSSLTYHAKALTADEIKENYALGYGWYSENANVLRNNVTDWFQCFYNDTISTATGATGSHSFRAKGQNGGEILNVWSGSNSKNYTMTTVWQNYNITLDDTLYFASTDTVYIDDIKSTKQKGYLQYLQYLDYIGAENLTE